MAHRRLFHPPHIRDDETRRSHRPVTWIELFFDLFVVVVLARTAHELGAAHFSPQALLTFLGQFVPLFWVWVGATYYVERFETEGLEFRLTLFCCMACVTALGAFSHDAMGAHFAGYAGAYAAGRAFTALLWLRAAAHNTPAVARGARSLAFGTLACGALVVASIFLEGWLRHVLFAAGLLLDILAPRLRASAQSAFPPVSTTKYPERFGLFTIIALGECAAGVVGGLGDAGRPGWLAGAGCLAIAFGMWWIYFDFVARRKFRQSTTAILGWVYAHIGLFAAVAVAGAAMRELLSVPESHAGLPLAVAVAVFLAMTALIESRLAAEPGEPAHPVLSPMIKVLSGAAAIVAGLFVHGEATLAATLVLCLLIPMLYGLWVWHKTAPPESSHS
jgi:low temperature requirement protein LtrA